MLKKHYCPYLLLLCVSCAQGSSCVVVGGSEHRSVYVVVFLCFVYDFVVNYIMSHVSGDFCIC